MSLGTISMLVLGGLFAGSLWLVLRYKKTITVLEVEKAAVEAEREVLEVQNEILTDRTRKPVHERLSDGSF